MQPRPVVEEDIRGEVLAAYDRHPDLAMRGPGGDTCGPDTLGVLTPRPVIAAGVRIVGKEARKFDEREAGVVSALEEVQHEYVPQDLAADAWWAEAVLPVLRSVPPSEVAALAGISLPHLSRLLAGKHRPHPRTRRRLARLADVLAK